MRLFETLFLDSQNLPLLIWYIEDIFITEHSLEDLHIFLIIFNSLLSLKFFYSSSITNLLDVDVITENGLNKLKFLLSMSRAQYLCFSGCYPIYI